MTDEQPILAGPRLSSIAGLQEAGILESFYFDPVVGLAGAVYTSAYLQIFRSGLLQFGDPAFLGAVMLDDPIAVRIWVEATAARLAGEGGTGGSPSRSVQRGLPDTRARIEGLGREVYGDDFEAFLQTPRRSLGWETPASLLERGDGRRVLEILMRAANGDFT